MPIKSAYELPSMAGWTSSVAQQTDTTSGYYGNNVGDGFYFHNGTYRVTIDKTADRLGMLFECFLIDGDTSSLVGSATVTASTGVTDWNIHRYVRTSDESVVSVITKWGGYIGYIGLQVAADGTMTTQSYTQIGQVANVLSNRFATAEVSNANGLVIITGWASTFVDTTWWVLDDAGSQLTTMATATLPDRPKPLWPVDDTYVVCHETFPYQSGNNYFTVRTAATGAKVAEYQFDGNELNVDQSLGDIQLMPDGRLVAAITRAENNFAVVKLTYMLITVDAADGGLSIEQITYVEGVEDPDCFNLKPIGDYLVALWSETWDYLYRLSIIDPTTGVREYEIALPAGLDETAPTNIEVMNDTQFWLEAYDYPVITDWLYTVSPPMPEIFDGPRGDRRHFLR